MRAWRRRVGVWRGMRHERRHGSARRDVRGRPGHGSREGSGWRKRRGRLRHWLSVGLVLAAVCGVLPALAQPDRSAETTEEQRRARARELYLEALEMIRRGDFEHAYDPIDRAWQLKKHYQIAGNLGTVELKLGRYRDAAEHLHFALREMRGASDVTEAETQVLQKLLDQAAGRVARVELTADWWGRRDWAAAEQEVELSIDGLPKKLQSTVFVAPGVHTFQVRGPGVASAPHRLETPAGSTHQLALSLRLVPTARGGSAPPPASSPAPAETPPVHDESARPVWPMIVGASVATVAAGLGIGAVVGARSASDDAEQLAAEVQGSATADAHVICSAPPDTLSGTCSDWRDANASTGTWWATAAASFVVAGAATVATVVYGLWPTEPDEEPTQPTATLLVSSSGAAVRVTF